MRVLMFSTDKKVFEEGSAVRERMREYGTLFNTLHVVVHTTSENRQLTEQIAKNVWLYPTNTKYRILYFLDSYRLIRNTLVREGALDADVITAQDPETGIVAYVVSKRYKKKFHLQLHSDYFSEFYGKNRLRFRAQRWLLLYLIPRADGIRVVSEKIKKDIEDRFTWVTKRIRVLPIYTDTAFFRNAKPDFDLHDRYPKMKFILLTVARLTTEKNIHFLVTVVKQLILENFHIGLVIVGSGPEETNLWTHIKEMHLEDIVVIEPWQEDLTSYYKTADLFVLSSHYEGYGRTLVEAAAAGLPFVTSDVGIASSLDGAAREILVCPVNDVGCFVRKIKGFLSDNELSVTFQVNMKNPILSQISQSKEEYLREYKRDIEETQYTGVTL